MRTALLAGAVVLALAGCDTGEQDTVTRGAQLERQASESGVMDAQHWRLFDATERYCYGTVHPANLAGEPTLDESLIDPAKCEQAQADYEDWQRRYDQMVERHDQELNQP